MVCGDHLAYRPTVSTGGAQTSPSVAIDSNGDAVVAWETPAGGGFYTIDAAYRPAGGAWQQPRPVDDDAVKDVTPSVAFTPGGDATIVWETENGSDEAVASATTTTGTSWTSPIQVATDTTFLAVQVALDSSGEATAAYSGFDGTGLRARRRGASARRHTGTWTGTSHPARTGRIRSPSTSRSMRRARPR